MENSSRGVPVFKKVMTGLFVLVLLWAVFEGVIGNVEVAVFLLFVSAAIQLLGRVR